MPEEEVATPEAEATLEAPSAEVVTEEQEVTPEAEPEVEVPAEPDDNAERSRLGRKVKELETTIQLLTESLKTKAEPEGLDFGDDIHAADDDEEISFRKGDLRKEIVNVINKVLPKTVPKILDKKSNEEKQYERAALIAIAKLGGDLSEDEFKPISESLGKTFNRYTGNPEADARMNFLEAQNALLKKDKKTKKNPLDKNKGKEVKNLGGGGGETAPTKKQIVLSAEMKALQKKYGLSDEAAMRAAKQLK